jgi:hypothetical protein
MPIQVLTVCIVYRDPQEIPLKGRAIVLVEDDPKLK